MKIDEFWLKMTDDIQCFGRRWIPPQRPRAVVCLVHGFAEHTGSYHFVAERFTEAGIAMMGTDWRGHGRSQGLPGYTPSYEKQTLADVTSLITAARKEFPDIPLFLFGHSMGGGMVLNHILRFPNSDISGVICTSPLLRLPEVKMPSTTQRILLRIAAAIAPKKVRHTRTPDTPYAATLEECVLVRDVAHEKKLRQDPLRNTAITLRMMDSTLRYGQWALDHAAELRKPLLLSHGTGDKVTSSDASAAFAAAAPADLITFKPWPDTYHELHKDINREEVFAFIVHWLDERISSLT